MLKIALERVSKWLKHGKCFFGLEKDINLAVVYIAPENSQSHDLYGNDLFNALEYDVSHFSSQGYVFIAGDINSRVCQRSDYVENDCNLHIEHLGDHLIPLKRTSCNSQSNRFGDYLLDLC